MSMSRHSSSRLGGWNGPFYPALTSSLVAALDQLPEGERDIASIRSKVQGAPSFVQAARPAQTTDGYQWLAALEFNVQGGKVLVAIPDWNDSSRADGTALDRAPAAYLRGQYTNVETANAIVARVIRALRPGPGRRPILAGP